MTNYRLIIFDWDGTLVDSEAAIVDAFRQAYQQASHRAPTYDEVRNIIGLNLNDAAAQLSPNLGSRMRLEIVDNYRSNYANLKQSPKLFPSVSRVLRELNGQGYALAIATGKSRRGLQKGLAESDLGDLFVATRTGDQCESKPSPMMLDEILDELKIEAKDALMIGDTEFDLAMARAAGVPRAAVSYGAHSVERLGLFNPIFMLDKFSQLPEELNRHHDSN